MGWWYDCPTVGWSNYSKVGSSSLSWLVAHFWVFRLFMKGKFDAYVLWPLAKSVQNWMVSQSTAPDFTVFIFFIKKNVVNHQYYKNSREMWKYRCMYNRKLLFLKWFYSILRGWFLKWQLLLTSLQWGGLIKRFCDVNKTLKNDCTFY